MFKRHIISSIHEALDDTPVVVITGARQTGKSTLCRQLIEQNIFHEKYVTLDDPTTLTAAHADPLGFLQDVGPRGIIDEVQRAPELLVSLKKLVDQDRETARFILTGSANVMVLPAVSDSLAGRIEIHHLWPLSQDEIKAIPSVFLDALVSTHPFGRQKSSWEETIKALSIGGYPESVKRKAETRRSKWFESYINSILQKDIRELADISGLTQIPNLLQLISARVGSTINMADISRLSGVKSSTLQRYIALLKNVFLLVDILPLTPNIEGRFVKSPKLYFNDTGLLCHLRGEDKNSLLESRSKAGPVLENFVVMEIVKQLSWSNHFIKAYHFSTHKGAEVDLVLEDRRKRLYGIEIKSSAALGKNDFKGLIRLSELSSKFQKGIVLYMGEETVCFGKNLYAVPMPFLWKGA